MDDDLSDAFIGKVKCFFERGGLVQSRNFAGLIVPELASTLMSKASVSLPRRTLFKRYLPDVLTFIMEKQNQPMSVATVLGGLYANDCWRDCLVDDRHAYSLAAALLVYIGSYKDGFILDDVTCDGICALLNEWLKPDSPWAYVPPSSVVAAHMFGDAWCHLFLPANVDDQMTSGQMHDHNEDGTTPEYAAGVLAMSEKPPFLPGLYASGSAVTTMSLPLEIGGTQ